MIKEDALTDNEWLIYDELISDGFEHEMVMNIIESNYRNN